MKALLALAVLLLATFPALGSERVTVCAKYRADYGWSKGYKVEATVTKGSELNRATRSYDYTSYSTYVVIFWDRDEVSVIEMDWPTLSHMGTEGEDKRGVKWEISKSTSFCY